MIHSDMLLELLPPVMTFTLIFLQKQEYIGIYKESEKMVLARQMLWGKIMLTLKLATVLTDLDEINPKNQIKKTDMFLQILSYRGIPELNVTVYVFVLLGSFFICLF